MKTLVFLIVAGVAAAKVCHWMEWRDVILLAHGMVDLAILGAVAASVTKLGMDGAAIAVARWLAAFADAWRMFKVTLADAHRKSFEEIR